MWRWWLWICRRNIGRFSCCTIFRGWIKRKLRIIWAHPRRQSVGGCAERRACFPMTLNRDKQIFSTNPKEKTSPVLGLVFSIAVIIVGEFGRTCMFADKQRIHRSGSIHWASDFQWIGVRCSNITHRILKVYSLSKKDERGTCQWKTESHGPKGLSLSFSWQCHYTTGLRKSNSWGWVESICA